MGLKPTDSSFFCSHSGEGPFLTPRTSRPAKVGQAAASEMRMSIGQGKWPATGLTDRFFSRPTPAAARSRAMPATPSQSGRLGVTSKSITASRPRASAAGVPTGNSASSTMPSDSSAVSSSLAEHIMPLETTPRTGLGSSVMPLPGM